MDDQAVRIGITLVVLGVAVLVAAIARKVKTPAHPDITIGDVGDRPGVVLFTSTDCSNCKDAIAVLKKESIPFREVTHDLEPQRFETWSVVAVPLTVILDKDSRVVEMMSGVPPLRRLLRAVAAAGIKRS